MAEQILEATNVWKSYGGIHALRGAAFRLEPGEVHALMGENGAGKSTLAKIIAGVIAPDDGVLFVSGAKRQSFTPPEAQAEGISMIHQELDLFGDLSIAENIVIGNRNFREGNFVRPSHMDQFAAESLAKVGLQVSPRRRVSSLGIGDMQLVAIARALSMRSRVILMDEPTSSLFHDSTERLFDLVSRLKAENVSVVYVSHKMDEIFRLCDRMTVLRDGITVGTRKREDTTTQELISLMVGREWNPSLLIRGTVGTIPALTVAGLTTGKVSDVSFTLHRGEVLGVAGLVGSGRSELGRALAGLDRWQSGSVSIGSSTLPKNHIALLPEDRKLDGLMMQMSIRENGTISTLPKLARFGLTNRKREGRALKPILRQVRLKVSSSHEVVGSLSGGNQQKVLLARCLLDDTDIVFLDDPTRGIDVSAKEDIYAVIAALAGRGKSILFVSSELLRCCHRVLVMRSGRIVAQLDSRNTSQEEIMLYATNPVSSPGSSCLN